MGEQIKSRRIAWIDIAKAIAIFAMIQGHTTPYGSAARNFIYSFHMPLFFILTGFTSKSVNTFSEFWKQLKKDFLKILLPCIGVQALNGLISLLMYQEDVRSSISLRLEQLLWGSAIDVYGHSCIGMIWFLVALFWTKTLYNLVQVIFPSEYYGAICFVMAICAKALSNSQIYLPQSWDVVLMASLFLYLGYCYKKYFDSFKRFHIPVSIISFGVWMLCWEKGIYIELGGRWYPNFILGVLAAICGCLCVFEVAQALEANRYVAKVLSYFGKNTMIILCVSFLDWIALPFWGKGLSFAYVARPAVVLLVSVIVIEVKKCFNRLCKK